MIIIGIDPGLQVTGYGVLNSDGHNTSIVEAGVIRTSEGDGFEGRLNEIYTEVGDIIRQHSPDYIAIEELYSHYAHPRTAIVMGHARGMIFLQAARCGVPIVSYSATRIKKSLTGNGRASKGQIRRNIKSVLKLKDELMSPDTADALAAALCHHNVLAGRRHDFANQG
jgi:crossover junction endodeoxyribonuclease RuvC